MTKIPHDDILEGLYKLRIRESEKLETVLELYDLEKHQKKVGPDYHRLKTKVKRSIEQEIRNRNFGNRIGNYERNAVVKNQGTKQRRHRIPGDCMQWETLGQCVKGDTCSFLHDINKRGKSSPSNPSPNSFMRQNERKPPRTRSPRGSWPSGRMSRWLLWRNCNNSFCENWHPPECFSSKTKSGCRFGEKCSFAHRQVDEQPTKRSKKSDGKSAVALLKKGDWQEREPVTDECHDRPGKLGKRSVEKFGQLSQRRFSDARQLGCVFQDMMPPKSILRKSTDMPKPIQRVKFTAHRGRPVDIDVRGHLAENVARLIALIFPPAHFVRWWSGWGPGRTGNLGDAPTSRSLCEANGWDQVERSIWETLCLPPTLWSADAVEVRVRAQSERYVSLSLLLDGVQ